jgi:hypothetical protein
MYLFYLHLRPFDRFLAISTGVIYWYYTYLLKIDEEEYGGHGALLQEGLFASFTLFLVTCLFQELISFYVSKTYHPTLLLAAFVGSSIQSGSLLRSSFVVNIPCRQEERTVLINLPFRWSVVSGHNVISQP